jgi:hypothetical protein
MALAICLILLSALDAGAGGPLAVFAKRPVVFRNSAFPLTWQLDPGVLGNYSNAQAAQIVNDSFAAWENIPTAMPSFDRGTDLPQDVTVTNYTNYWGKFQDGIMPVLLDSDGQIVDAIRGSNAKNQVLGLAVSAYFTSGPDAGFYAEGEVLINGFLSNKTSLQEYIGVVKHEIGHLIGLDHAQIGKSEGTDGDASNDAAVPLMFPISTSNAEFTSDDIVAVSNLYPTSGFLSGRGALSGMIRRRDGTQVRGANVIAINAADPSQRYSTVSDYFGNAPGVYEFRGLPAGSYLVLTEPIVERFTGGSSVGPYAKTSGDLSFVNPVFFEYYNGAGESHDHLADRPDDRAPVDVAAGRTTANINFLANDPPNEMLDRYFVDSAAVFVPLPFAGQTNTLPPPPCALRRCATANCCGFAFLSTAAAMRFKAMARCVLRFHGRAAPIQDFRRGSGSNRGAFQNLTHGLVVPYELRVGDRNIVATAGQDFLLQWKSPVQAPRNCCWMTGRSQLSHQPAFQRRCMDATEQLFQKPRNLMLATAIGGQPQEVGPVTFLLEQNYPNPFIVGKMSSSPQTTFRFVLPQAARGELSL